MGLAWSKEKSRQQGNVARQAAIDYEYADALERRSTPHAQRLAELERLMADCRVPVQRLAAQAALRCRSCGHRGTARVPPGAAPRFRCSHCGSSLVKYSV